jgi:hypothetical protein
MHKGTVLMAGQLDQAKIPVTDFRTETMPIPVKDNIKLRKLFQDAGLKFKPDDELAGLGEQFLALMEEFAGEAGGDAPMPVCPKTTLLDSIHTLAGNEMLAAILKEHDELKGKLSEWQTSAKRAEKRKLAWETLCDLVNHANELPEVTELQTEADAIRDERRLLEDSDPVPVIHDKVVKLLRNALKKVYAANKEAYDREMKSLGENANWTKIKKSDQERLLTEVGIVAVGDLDVGNDAALIAALSERSLPVWSATLDALPERFRQSALAAAKLLEPKTQSVQLKSGTLKTPGNVMAWLAETEKDLLARLKKGPIVIN